jgi:hypothetical protein
MSSRQLRRRQERQARKAARKTEMQPTQTTTPEAATAPLSSAQANRADVNRANAQHSTGPRTEAGKQASSRNAFRHGLYAKQLALPGEDPAELDALRADLRREHQPLTPTEDILVNELAEHYWRLRRMRKFEARIMGTGTVEELERGLALLPIVQRTMASAERGFHKALTALRQLQKERASHQASERHAPEHEPTGFVPQTATTHNHQPGFVSQNALEPASTSDLSPQNLYKEAA